MATIATPIKILGNTKKHWTNEEKAKRSAAEDGLRRDNVQLRMPAYLKTDKDAVSYWKKTIREAAELELYDNTDTDTLAAYCKIMSRIKYLNKQFDLVIGSGRALFEDDMPLIREIRQQETLQKQYAIALGLTPESRARLARKRSTEVKDDADDLYGEA